MAGWYDWSHADHTMCGWLIIVDMRQTKSVHEGYEQSLHGSFEAFFMKLLLKGKTTTLPQMHRLTFHLTFFLRHSDQDVI